ncbi:hypothetical protein M0R45_016255 [Rubus argutus]|uniref:Uncharacterized protein n=1 Tax=Rubus argutus TaxID=59490 RepID=A0AAW1XSA7_RUBAR
MTFSKAILLVLLAVLLIFSVVSAHRDLAETTNTPTTDHDGRGLYPGVAIGGNIGRSVSCNRGSKQPCQRGGGKGGNGVPKCNDPTNRACNSGSNGGKGGNGERGGRGGHGPETKN